MALTERTVVDKIEVLNEYKQVHIRTAIIIERDGVELSRVYSRKVIAPGDDYSAEADEVKAICSQLHTQEAIEAYKALAEASE